jgi:hypothetical protein
MRYRNFHCFIINIWHIVFIIHSCHYSSNKKTIALQVFNRNWIYHLTNLKCYQTPKGWLSDSAARNWKCCAVYPSLCKMAVCCPTPIGSKNMKAVGLNLEFHDCLWPGIRFGHKKNLKFLKTLFHAIFLNLNWMVRRFYALALLGCRLLTGFGMQLYLACR